MFENFKDGYRRGKQESQNLTPAGKSWANFRILAVLLILLSLPFLLLFPPLGIVGIIIGYLSYKKFDKKVKQNMKPGF
ncbi:MAG: hypothetical protein ACE14P_06275 [Methanotrichaceae archaeon]